MESPLDSFFAERFEISEALTRDGELSLVNTFNTDLPRIFVVAAASHFEKTVSQDISAFFAEKTHQHEEIMQFMDRRALFRNYHSLFDWDTKKPNKFFSLFGGNCKDHYTEQVAQNDWLGPAAQDFLELGQARNLLVHGDFSTHSPTLTAEEVRTKFASAQHFTEAIPSILRLLDVPVLDGE